MKTEEILKACEFVQKSKSNTWVADWLGIYAIVIDEDCLFYDQETNWLLSNQSHIGKLNIHLFAIKMEQSNDWFRMGRKFDHLAWTIFMQKFEELACIKK